jgi:hypothetical protein
VAESKWEEVALLAMALVLAMLALVAIWNVNKSIDDHVEHTVRHTAAILACKEGGIGVAPCAVGRFARRPVSAFLGADAAWR